MKKLISVLFALLICAIAMFSVAATEAAAPADSATTSAPTTEEVDVNLTTVYYTPEDKITAIKKASLEAFGTESLLQMHGYTLYIHPDTAEIVVVHDATGQTLFSNPYDLASSSASDSIKQELLSQLMITYLDKTNGQTKEYNSYKDAAKEGQVIIEQIKNGIRVEYTIGRADANYLVPRLISKDRFESQILGKLDKTDKGQSWAYTKLYAFYYLYDPNDTTKADSVIKSMNSRYPVTKTGMAVYALTDIFTREFKELESYIKEYLPDYSYDEMEYDHAMTQYEGDNLSAPVFRLALEYTLTEDGLEVTLPANGIRFDETLYTLENIILLPYMGAGRYENKGYTFVPDGSGALMEFMEYTEEDKENGIEPKTTSIAGTVYGMDFAYQTLDGSPNQDVIRMPVYGIRETASIDEYELEIHLYEEVIPVGELANDDVKALTAEHIAALTPAHIAAFVETQIPALTVEQFGMFTKEQFAAFAPAHIAMLTEEQFAAIDVATFTAEQITGLNSKQIESVTAEKLGTLSVEQKEAFTASQIKTFSDEQLLVLKATLTADQIAALSNEQLKTLGIADLSLAQKNALSSAQIKGLSSDDLMLVKDVLTVEQISALTADQFKTIGVDNISVEQFAGLTSSHIGTLTVEQFAALSAEFKAALTPAQIGGLKTDYFKTLNIAILTPEQISGITNAQIKLTEKVTVVEEGVEKEVSVLIVTPEELASLTTEQKQAIAPSAVSKLTTEQLAVVYAAFTPEQIAKIANAEFATLDLSVLSAEQISGITKNQISKVTVEALSVLTAEQVAGFEEIIPEFSVDQLASIVEKLSDAEIRKVVGKQKTGLAEMGITLREVAAEQTPAKETTVEETVVETPVEETTETEEAVELTVTLVREKLVYVRKGSHNEDRGFFAIVKEGDALSKITAIHENAVHEYNTVQLSFNPRPKDTYTLNGLSVGGNNEISVVSDRKYVGNYTVKYFMLLDDTLAQEANITDYYETSWIGMANAYRDYLENEGVITRLTDADVSKDIPLYIETFGATETVEKVFSVPTNVSKALTSFENIKTMYDELAAAGITNVNFKLTGYANGGMYATIPYKLNWEKSVGGEEGFADLVKYAAEKGFGIYPDFDFSYVKRQENFDGLSLSRDILKTIDNRYSSLREYDASLQEYVSYFTLCVSPSAYMNFYDNFSSRYLPFGNSSISLSTIASALNSDFDEDDPYNRADSKDLTVDFLERVDGDVQSIMSESPNVYTWKYVDKMLNVSLQSSRSMSASATVPFMGVVLHGYVEFAGTPINMAGDISYELLRAIESGAGMYFILSYDNTELLKEDPSLSKYYSVRYEIWAKEEVEDANGNKVEKVEGSELYNYYTELNALLADLQTSTIVDHEFRIGERIPSKAEQAADDLAAAEKAEAEAKAKADAEYKAKLEAMRENYETLGAGVDVDSYVLPETESGETEETEEGYKYTKYTSDNNSIVLVTYENGTKFILNYNDFKITTVVDGVDYEVNGYGYVRIDN